MRIQKVRLQAAEYGYTGHNVWAIPAPFIAGCQTKKLRLAASLECEPTLKRVVPWSASA